MVRHKVDESTANEGMNEVKGIGYITQKISPLKSHVAKKGNDCKSG
jgi:hypothetical protein